MFLYKTKISYCSASTRRSICESMQFYIFNVFKRKSIPSKFFKVCSHFKQRFFKFSGISSSQSKEIFHSCCKINFVSTLDGVKSPNRYDCFYLIVLLSGFHNIPKALSNEILSKSRLTDWYFAEKSS